MGVQRLKPAAGGATIKSVQRGTITIAVASASNTATVTAVDTSKTQMTHLGTDITAAGTDTFYPRDAYLVLTNSTTVTATRRGNNEAVVVSYELLEWQQS